MSNRLLMSIFITLALSLSGCQTPTSLSQGNPTSEGDILAQDHQTISFKSEFAQYFGQNSGGSETAKLVPSQSRSFAALTNPPKPAASLPPAASKLSKMALASAKPLERLDPPESLWKRVLTQARQYLHTPYRLGSSLRTGRGTDCSGFVQYIYDKFDIDLPRSSAAQARVGEVAARTMNFAKLMPGDLLFFRRSGRRIGHVGIYMGDAKMIHASAPGYGVIVSELDQPYYERRFVVAKRVL